MPNALSFEDVRDVAVSGCRGSWSAGQALGFTAAVGELVLVTAA